MREEEEHLDDHRAAPAGREARDLVEDGLRGIALESAAFRELELAAAEEVRERRRKELPEDAPVDEGRVLPRVGERAHDLGARALLDLALQVALGLLRLPLRLGVLAAARGLRTGLLGRLARHLRAELLEVVPCGLEQLRDELLLDELVDGAVDAGDDERDLPGEQIAVHAALGVLEAGLVEGEVRAPVGVEPPARPDLRDLLVGEHPLASIFGSGLAQRPPRVALHVEAHPVGAHGLGLLVGEERELAAGVLRTRRAGAGGGDQRRVGRVEGRVDQAEHVAVHDVAPRIRGGPHVPGPARLGDLLRGGGLERRVGDLGEGERHRELEAPRGEELARLGAERAQADAPVDVRRRLPDLRREVLRAVAVLGVEALEPFGLLHRVDVGPLGVLDDLRLDDLAVAHVADGDGDLGEPRARRGAEAAVAEDDLVVVVSRAHEERREDAARADGLRELVEVAVVLARVRGRLAQRAHRERGLVARARAQGQRGHVAVGQRGHRRGSRVVVRLHCTLTRPSAAAARSRSALRSAGATATARRRPARGGRRSRGPSPRRACPPR